MPSLIQSIRGLVRSLPNRGYLVVLILLALSGSLVQVIFAHLVRQLVDVIAGQVSDGMVWVRYTVLLIAYETASQYFRARISGLYAEDAVRSIRDRLNSHLLLLPVDVVQGTHSAEILSRMSSDIDRLKAFFSTTLVEGIVRPLTAVMALMYLSLLNWQLTLVASMCVPAIVLLSSRISRPIGDASRELQAHMAEGLAVVQDALRGREIVKAYTLENSLLERYSEKVDATVRSSRGLSLRKSYLGMTANIMGIVPLLIIFGVGGLWVTRGILTPGGLFAFMMLMNHLSFPVSALPKVVGEARSQLSAGYRALELLEWTPERESGVLEIPIGGKPAVSFQNVTFAYSNGATVLDNVSFTINEGEVVAIVGPSGGGKSTILKLIQGLYAGVEGISVFGRDVNTWSLEALRRQIAYVPQDIKLFPGTLEQNLRLSKNTAQLGDISEATKLAGAHEFIVQLPHGYKSDVGELGDNLSGGQRQRIALAMAFLKDAPILLLDEISSSLDVEAELEISRAILTRRRHQTVIIVTHRYATLTDVDRVIVLSKGHIQEEGSHAELLARRGSYHDLYTKQIER